MNRLRRWLIYKLGGVLPLPLPAMVITQRGIEKYTAKIILQEGIPEEVAMQELYHKASYEILPRISEIKKDFIPQYEAYEYELRVFAVPKEE